MRTALQQQTTTYSAPPADQPVGPGALLGPERQPLVGRHAQLCLGRGEPQSTIATVANAFVNADTQSALTVFYPCTLYHTSTCQLP